jgi:hypothetical protein
MLPATSSPPVTASGFAVKRVTHYPTPEVAAALFPNGNSVYCITDMQAAQQRNFWGASGLVW